MREVTIAPAAKRAARLVGICGNIEARLRRMARRSAPVTHDAGNRRFREFVLSIDRGVILDVNRMDWQEPND